MTAPDTWLLSSWVHFGTKSNYYESCNQEQEICTQTSSREINCEATFEPKLDWQIVGDWEGKIDWQVSPGVWWLHREAWQVQLITYLDYCSWSFWTGLPLASKIFSSLYWSIGQACMSDYLQDIGHWDCREKLEADQGCEVGTKDEYRYKTKKQVMIYSQYQQMKAQAHI